VNDPHKDEGWAGPVPPVQPNFIRVAGYVY